MIELLPSLKTTMPVGTLPETLAVKVAFVPGADGLGELTSVVAVV